MKWMSATRRRRRYLRQSTRACSRSASGSAAHRRATLQVRPAHVPRPGPPIVRSAGGDDRGTAGQLALAHLRRRRRALPTTATCGPGRWPGRRGSPPRRCTRPCSAAASRTGPTPASSAPRSTRGPLRPPRRAGEGDDWVAAWAEAATPDFAVLGLAARACRVAKVAPCRTTAPCSKPRRPASCPSWSPWCSTACSSAGSCGWPSRPGRLLGGRRRLRFRRAGRPLRRRLGGQRRGRPAGGARRPPLHRPEGLADFLAANGLLPARQPAGRVGRRFTEVPGGRGGVAGQPVHDDRPVRRGRRAEPGVRAPASRRWRPSSRRRRRRHLPGHGRRPGAGARGGPARHRGVDFTAFRGVDAVIGGPPCQPWSLGGLRRGHADPRRDPAVRPGGPRGGTGRLRHGERGGPGGGRPARARPHPGGLGGRRPCPTCWARA